MRRAFHNMPSIREKRGGERKEERQHPGTYYTSFPIKKRKFKCVTSKLQFQNNDPHWFVPLGSPLAVGVANIQPEPYKFSPLLRPRCVVSFTIKKRRGKQAICPLTWSGFPWAGTGGVGSEGLTSGDVGSGTPSVTSPPMRPQHLPRPRAPPL